MEHEISYKDEYQIGDRIVLKLSSEDIFEGVISDLGVNRIDLVNAKQHNNSNILSGSYSFYRNEIEEIHRLAEEETEKPDAIVEKNVDLSKIKLSDSEYDRLKEVSREFIYLDKADSRYFEAIELLRRSETIGVAALGVEKDRSGSIKLLAVSMWDAVYLFDFVSHKQSYFYPELKEIFEASYICKVIHEAGPLLDIFYRKYNVFVKNTFDTQITDMVIKKKEIGSIPVSLSDLSDLLTDYLHFPTNYLQKALETTNLKWSERPLSERRRSYAAQLVTYLIILKDYMQKRLFSELYDAIENVHNYYYYLDCFQFSSNWNSKNIPKEVDNLIPRLLNKAERDKTEHYNSKE